MVSAKKRRRVVKRQQKKISRKATKVAKKTIRKAPSPSKPSPTIGPVSLGPARPSPTGGGPSPTSRPPVSKPFLTVEAVVPTGTKIQKRITEIGKDLSILRTTRSRQRLRKEPGTVIAKTEARIIGLEAEKLGLGITQIPRQTFLFGKALVKGDIKVKDLPKAVKEGAVQSGKLLRTDPGTAILKVGGEIFLLKGTGTTLKVVGKAGKNTRAILSPGFKGIDPKVITFGTGKTTTTIKVGGTVKKLAEPLGKQAKLAGKEVTAVSAQADRLVNLIKTKRVIRKPIPDEANLPKPVKVLLKKFDQGKLNKKQFLKLERGLNVKGQSILERSFFADPRGRFRPSRLGREPKGASLLDLLSGDVTFRTPKPQILVFEKAVVQKFPKTQIFKTIKRKLKTGGTLTATERTTLLKFQTKVSGKFKPIGALTREPEITLAPGEIVKRGRVIGRTIIQGKAVPIVSVSVVKASRRITRLLKKAKSGKIKTKELKILERALKKETGFRPRLSRGRIGRPSVRARPLIRPRARIRRRIISRRIAGRPTRRRPRRARGRTPGRRITGRPPRRPPKRPPTGRPPGRPPRRPPTRIAPPVPVLFKFPKRGKRKIKRRVKREQGFFVFAKPTKGRKKFIKLSKNPLSRRDAKDLGSFIGDKSLARTFIIKKTKLPIKKLKLKIPTRHFSKTQEKFRTFKIVKGKRVPIKNTFIEKRKRLLDTRSEKKGITLRRKLAQLRKPKRKIKRRKR